jgi:hypothetical protein
LELVVKLTQRREETFHKEDRFFYLIWCRREVFWSWKKMDYVKLLSNKLKGTEEGDQRAQLAIHAYLAFCRGKKSPEEGRNRKIPENPDIYLFRERIAAAGKILNFLGEILRCKRCLSRCQVDIPKSAFFYTTNRSGRLQNLQPSIIADMLQKEPFSLYYFLTRRKDWKSPSKSKQQPTMSIKHCREIFRLLKIVDQRCRNIKYFELAKPKRSLPACGIGQNCFNSVQLTRNWSHLDLSGEEDSEENLPEEDL